MNVLSITHLVLVGNFGKINTYTSFEFNDTSTEYCIRVSLDLEKCMLRVNKRNLYMAHIYSVSFFFLVKHI